MASRKQPLIETHPVLAQQADGWDPAELTSGSDKKMPWACSFGHRWTAAVSSRARGAGCPVCANQLVMPGVNDLATVDPKLAEEAHGWDPTTVSRWSNKKVMWCCSRGHVFPSRVADRSKGNGCPFCSNQKILVGFNDLATTNPELAAEALGWDPKTLASKSGKKVEWRCNLGHIWSATVAHRSNGTGCPVCAGREVLVGFNDLASRNPDLASEAHGWDPKTVTAVSQMNLSWRCSLGHVWKSTVGNRAKGKGCPFCAHQRLLAGFNDLETKHPQLAVEAHGWDPKTVISGSNSKREWKCHLGHVWCATVASRTAGTGCPVCSGRTAWPGFNDLKTVNPQLAAEADGWDTTLVTPISGQKRRWKCSEGHTWVATVASRATGRGCPTCAKFGFDPNKQSWLYFLEHPILDMQQIGISNVIDIRLAKHSRGGWEVIEVRGPMEGHLAVRLESEMLRALKRRGAVLGNKAEIHKFDGFTEAWTTASIKIESIKQLLEWVYDDDEVLHP